MLSRPLAFRADEAAEFLTILANAKRLIILQHLLKSEMTVNAIADAVGLSQSALSQHLAKLRALYLVTTRRDRQMIYYSCDSANVRIMLETLDEMFAETAH